MQPVTAPETVHAAIARAKASGGRFGTNFFLAPPALQAAIAAGAISMYEPDSGGAVAIAQREELFHRVYFAAGSAEAATAAVQAIAVPQQVADVIGRPADTAPWVDALGAAGFVVYTRFQRMSRLGGTATAAGIERQGTAEATVANADDAAEVREAIATHFDPYAERIPPLEEVRHAAAAGQIILSREARALAALLYFETQGVTTHLRYWLGLPAFRGRGHTHALMHHYLTQAAPAARRFILWVEQTNARAIPLYERYGYTREGIEDVILRKPGVEKKEARRG